MFKPSKRELVKLGMFGSYNYLTLDNKGVVKSLKPTIYEAVRKKVKEKYEITDQYH
jgi:hypothetical protein